MLVYRPLGLVIVYQEQTRAGRVASIARLVGGRSWFKPGAHYFSYEFPFSYWTGGAQRSQRRIVAFHGLFTTFVINLGGFCPYEFSFRKAAGSNQMHIIFHYFPFVLFLTGGAQRSQRHTMAFHGLFTRFVIN